MGIINSLFGKKNTTKESKKMYMNWIPLTTKKQIKEIQKHSINEPVLIFKHSTRCGISNMVIRKFEESFTEEMQAIKLYYLDLLTFRELSNEISYEFQVLHQSPQLLIIKNGEALVHASHYEILEVPLITFVK